MSEWTELPTQEIVKNTIDSLKSRNFTVHLVQNKKEALEKLKELLPRESQVMTGSSTTLHQIGFMDYFQHGDHGWDNLMGPIANETDMGKRMEKLRHAILSDNFLASVNAIVESGELVAAGLTGSRTGAFPFGAKRLILVVSTSKIVSSLEEAFQRVREYVFPLEDERAQKTYGMNSAIGKWVILEQEVNPQRITIILVEEQLGF